MLKNISYVKKKLEQMNDQQIWPNGLRYLWTDAFGVVLLASMYHQTEEDRYLDQAEKVVDEVKNVLGREKGVRIGEQPGRYGQYYHYLAMWLYALHILSRFRFEYHKEAIQLAKDIHPHFVIPGVGVHWKMKEDLSGPEPGHGFGALDCFHGYVVYNLIDPDALKQEIMQMKELIDSSYRNVSVDQDLGLGMMLWMCRFHEDEAWARFQKKRSLEILERLWVDPPGYFCRQKNMENVKFAFTNFGISVGLQSADVQMKRVKQVNAFFAGFKSGDAYESDAITHVMECSSNFPGFLMKDYDKMMTANQQE